MILPLLGIGLLIGAACYTVFLKPKLEEEDTVYKETQVEFGNLVQGITESGSVEFVTNHLDYDLELSFLEEEEEEEEDDEEEEAEAGYLRVEEVYAANGQRIEVGDPIFKLTEKSIRSLRQKIETARSDAEIALEEAKTDNKLEALTAKQTYDSSSLDGTSAETVYQLETQSLQKEIEQEQAKIAAWNLEVTQIEDSLEDSWETFEELEEEYEDLEYEFNHTDQKASITKYIAAREAYLASKETYEKTQEERLDQRDKMAEIKEDIENQQQVINELVQKLERKNLDAKQSFENSNLSGELASEIYQYSVEALQEAEDVASQELAEIEKALTEFDEFVGDGTIYAKESGLITEIAYEKDNYIKTQGALFTYAYNDRYAISVDISEEDIPYVAVGKEVTIEFNAYPEVYYSGVVTEVKPEASADYDTMVSYPVTIQVTDDTVKLFGGMTGDVTFVTDEAKDTLYVSKKAIVKEEDKSYVYQLTKNGQYERIEVETGFSDGINIEIINGLEKGEIVYIASKSENQ